MFAFLFLSILNKSRADFTHLPHALFTIRMGKDVIYPPLMVPEDYRTQQASQAL